MRKRPPYLTLLVCCSVFLVALVAAVNALVDPYNMFGTQRIVGFNADKPFAGERGRVAKLYQSLRAAPRGLVSGNSRPEMGLDPDHSCWPADAQPVYNAALPGLKVYSQVRYAQHAQAKGAVRALVMGVDFVDFLQKEFPTEIEIWPPKGQSVKDKVFAVDPRGQPVKETGWVRFSHGVDALLSLDALKHSLVTVARQRSLVPTMTTAGFHAAEGIYLRIIRDEGARALFAEKNKVLSSRFRGGGWKLFPEGKAWSPEFEAVRRLIRQSKASGTVTVLAVNPLHAEFLLILDAAGLWPQMEKWKQAIAQLGQDENVPVWDFSLFDSRSTEPVAALPARGQGLSWFWEPTHYRKELGDLMLANIWRDHCPANITGAPSYGVRLDQMNKADLRQFLFNQRGARDTVKKTQPDVDKRIRGLLTRQD